MSGGSGRKGSVSGRTTRSAPRAELVRELVQSGFGPKLVEVARSGGGEFKVPSDGATRTIRVRVRRPRLGIGRLKK